jgi:hypothetical protein
MNNAMHLFAKLSIKWQHMIQIVSLRLDCMHVTSEDGIFTYRKVRRSQSMGGGGNGLHLVEVESNEPQVCGVYLMTDPDKVVEVEVEFTDASCELGNLLGVSQNIILSVINLKITVNI